MSGSSGVGSGWLEVSSCYLAAQDLCCLLRMAGCIFVALGSGLQEGLGCAGIVPAAIQEDSRPCSIYVLIDIKGTCLSRHSTIDKLHGLVLVSQAVVWPL